MSPSIDSPLPGFRPSTSRHGQHLTPSSSNSFKRSRTPCDNDRDAPRRSTPGQASDKDGPGDRRRRVLMKDLYARSERLISDFFSRRQESQTRPAQDNANDRLQTSSDPSQAKTRTSQKRSARAIDEDDYGDEEEDEEEEAPNSPTRSKEVSLSRTETRASAHSQNSNQPRPSTHLPADQSKTSEDVRKQLEEENRAAELAAKESFQNLFYTLENDHDAMLEQQKLDDLDRQVETEMSGQEAGASNSSGPTPQQGTLSSTNLGASSLTLKHLIAKIDAKRGQVHASDSQLRSLMTEVRKNRSKWASEEKVGQEELYEGADQVLLTLKASEMSAPFLTKVNKRDAPDYHNIIKNPMDIGTMIKKLKSLQYQSKKQFVDDLDLIWSNCLKYNAVPEHPLRRKAEHMRKETARLTPLIPDIVIRDRAEVEAEERRLHPEFDDGEESEDEPLMSTRGRKAPGKSSKKGTSSTTRKAPAANDERTTPPSADTKGSQALGTSNVPANLKHEHLKSDHESMDGSQRGFTTPPPGNLTPMGGSVAPASQFDASEIDGAESSINGVNSASTEEPQEEDEEYQTWKQVTKKDRARVAAERHRLFTRDQLNPDEPALLRSKAAMRRFLQKQGTKPDSEVSLDDGGRTISKGSESAQATTLAEGMDTEEDNVLPDYYAPLSNIPSINERLSWTEDTDGQVIDRREETLRALPSGIFKPPQGALTAKIDSNMRQMQETRKIVAKIGVVKQMQLQAQTYQNQFQKYEVAQLQDVDIEPTVISDEDPIMSPALCRAALQRSIGKIFYHAGFEDFQPSALETVTDITSNYFTQLVHTLGIYRGTPKVSVPVATTVPETASVKAPKRTFELKSRFTDEEALLHTLQAFSHDLEGLDSYVKEDMDRLSSRLEVHHGRTKDYLAELLRPALDPTAVGNDGVGAFNDGSEQFVGGDFAEDIDEDFFGFRELGLDKEFGLANLSVPLHLLQSRMRNAYQPQSSNANIGTGPIMPQPEPYPPISIETVDSQIGLVRDYFRKKLEDNDDEPLIEDDDLPMKQRFPKPRLPPTGKISSPRKRPIREQQMLARKKRRLEIEAEKERERQKEAEARGEVNGDSSIAPTTDGADGIAADTSVPAKDEGDKAEESNSVTVNGTKPSPPPAADTQSQEADADADADGEPDEFAGPLTPTSIKRLKLDAPAQKSSKTGDPQKKRPLPDPEQKSGDRDYGDGTSTPKRKKSVATSRDGDGEFEDEDGDGDGGEDANANGNRESGMLSPESLPIAAH